MEAYLQSKILKQAIKADEAKERKEAKKRDEERSIPAASKFLYKDITNLMRIHYEGYQLSLPHDHSTDNFNLELNCHVPFPGGEIRVDVSGWGSIVPNRYTSLMPVSYRIVVSGLDYCYIVEESIGLREAIETRVSASSLSGHNPNIVPDWTKPMKLKHFNRVSELTRALQSPEVITTPKYPNAVVESAS